jgi:hypothetical protein
MEAGTLGGSHFHDHMGDIPVRNVWRDITAYDFMNGGRPASAWEVFPFFCMPTAVEVKR